MSKRSGMKPFTRDTYNRVRKLDRRDMQEWAESIYNDGFKDGAAGLPDLSPERIRGAISGIKGIGPKKAEEITNAISALVSI